MKLTTAGSPLGIQDAIVGIVTRSHLAPHLRDRVIFVGPIDAQSEARGYRAIITPSRLEEAQELFDRLSVPMIHSVREHEHLSDQDIVVMQPSTGFVRTLHRPTSEHNGLFLTERCNSNCLMCSQPPKDRDDTEHFLKTNLELIELIDPSTKYLGITGGEPTLLGDGLFKILQALKERLPETQIHMLTNGRAFAWDSTARRLAAVGHPHLMLGIPLYSDDAIVHDYIVQAKNAFDQTILGLHRLARYGQAIEIRVVLHRQSIPRLRDLALYIYRNLPFVQHVALMGLEPTGYTPRNREALWIDPLDYQEELEDAVEILSVRGMAVSLYNSQLCLTRPSLWKFARKSISDWKNVYLPECQHCAMSNQCGGLFQSAERLHSPNIRAFPSVPMSQANDPLVTTLQ